MQLGLDRRRTHLWRATPTAAVVTWHPA